MSSDNIILTGFMGTGKTTVGRALADRLGWRFVDLDDRIAERAGKSVPAIFEEDGEAAFRDLETAVCRQIASERGLVVATGGGAVLRAANREALEKAGTVICLEATPDTILERVGAGNDRPMLGEGDRRGASRRVAGRAVGRVRPRAASRRHDQDARRGSDGSHPCAHGRAARGRPPPARPATASRGPGVRHPDRRGDLARSRGAPGRGGRGGGAVRDRHEPDGGRVASARLGGIAACRRVRAGHVDGSRRRGAQNPCDGGRTVPADWRRPSWPGARR